MKTSPLFLVLLGLLHLSLMGPGCSQQIQSSETHVESIRNVLETQTAQWNHGDIPAFMGTYVKTEALRFSSGGTVQRGWDATLQRYLTRYPNKDAMGRLEFEDLEIKMLSENWAEAHGRYRLYREGDYGDATGLFTLLMKNSSNGWKILHDHTSADAS